MVNWVNSKFKPKREEKQNQELLLRVTLPTEHTLGRQAQNRHVARKIDFLTRISFLSRVYQAEHR
jgi:hypothetical protein